MADHDAIQRADKDVNGDANGDASATAEAVARRSYGKLIAYLSARTRDVAGAEDALSEAFAAALADWPVNGIPRTPEAWLLTVARRKLIDSARRAQSGAAAEDVMQLIRELAEADEDAALASHIPDDRLRLMFACAHPAIDRGVRAPLMLQVILGFDAAAIASAFLVSPAAMGQRLARAKHKIRQAGIPFRVPEHEELRERLDVVLDAICLASAAEPGSMAVALQTVRAFHERLGVTTILGIGNAGFGMPDPTRIDLDYLIAAVRSRRGAGEHSHARLAGRCTGK